MQRVNKQMTVNTTESEQFLNAVRGRDLKKVSAYLKKHKNNPVLLNVSNQHGETALCLAVWHKNLEMINLLLTFDNIDVNLARRDSDNPLHTALRCDDYEMASLLLAHGADANVVDKDGYAPIRMLSLREYDLLELLLKHGAIVNASDFLMVVRVNNIDIIQRYINKYNPEERKEALSVTDQAGRTALYHAICYGEVAIVKLLLSLNTDNINQADNKGLTPLHVAASLGYADIVELLLEQHADVDQVSRFNRYSPLYCAVDGIRSKWLNPVAWENSVKVIKMLLDSHANVDLADNDDKTPLYVAVEDNQFVVIQMLIKQCASVNLPKKNGITPIYRAAYEGHLDAVKLLLSAGANVDLVLNRWHAIGFMYSDDNRACSNKKQIKSLIDAHVSANQHQAERHDEMSSNSNSLEGLRRANLAHFPNPSAKPHQACDSNTMKHSNYSAPH